MVLLLSFLSIFDYTTDGTQQTICIYKKILPLLQEESFFRDPCTHCCRTAPCVTIFHGSIRAPLQHTQVDCLVLLPSDPDTVHRLMLRKTQTSSPLPKGRPPGHTSKASITLTIADCEYRAPLPPRLARKYDCYKSRI